ncbi:E3 ubiquitin-protein ligase KCMF1-like isoform X2 [Photinus pyralis]|nr:E3 ubiquitin-protein ligase KCMF1-like isoform X2 [Photinus pyralis]XP_031351148.1 E3 ubiquitin-protein ligase KCMF1-like isoform X2 [Photinus pyralis]
MDRHEGVSCDSCLKGNFHGRRFKCLICYDYDLCSTCYEAGTTTSRHSANHAMQCILTKADFSLYYSGETLANTDQPQSYTCPLCGRMGFTESTLQEHVAADHADTSLEVVCPICAVTPGGDPNLMTDDFAGHLTLEHRTGPRELISYLDESFTARARRPPGRGGLRGRSAQSSSRRPFSSSNALSSLSLSSWDSIDPIAELLSQLSSVRRTANNATTANNSTSSQLQQLEMQLQLERQQAYTTMLQRGRASRRQLQNHTTVKMSTNPESSELTLKPSLILPAPAAQLTSSSPSSFILPKLLEEHSSQNVSETVRAERSRFVQQMILSTILP